MSERELPEMIQNDIAIREQLALELVQDIATMQAQQDGKEMAAADVWVPYTGPRGGEGWENTVTGERVYQKDKPGTGGAADDASGSESPEQNTVDLVGETYAFDDIPEGTRLDVGYIDEAVFVEGFGGGGDMPPIIYAIGTSGQKYSVEPRDVLDFGIPDPEYQKEYSAEEYEAMSNDARLLESFKTATNVKSFRESGGEGGSNNGDVLQVLEQPDGSKDFAVPVEHIMENFGEGVITGNLVASSLLASLGVRGVRTAVTTDATGVEYLVKDGADGLPGTKVQPGDIKSSEGSLSFIAEDRVAMLFAGWMLGNNDLHSGNYFYEGMPRGHIIIDHDYSWTGEYRYGIGNDVRAQTQHNLERYVQQVKEILTDSVDPQDHQDPNLHSESRRVVAQGVARVLNNYADGIEGYDDDVLRHDETNVLVGDLASEFDVGMRQVARNAAMIMYGRSPEFIDMLSDEARELFADELNQ
jgi:hypothetical protein